MLTALLLHSARLPLLPSHWLLWAWKRVGGKIFFKVVMNNSHLIALRDWLFLPYWCWFLYQANSWPGCAPRVKAYSYQLCFKIMQQGWPKEVGSCWDSAAPSDASAEMAWGRGVCRVTQLAALMVSCPAATARSQSACKAGPLPRLETIKKGASIWQMAG